MHPSQAIAATADRSAIVVDLIGDLDSTLGAISAETLDGFAARNSADIFISTKHVALTTRDGLARLEAAVVRARARGCSVALEPGNRKMRAAFAFARIACEAAPHRPDSRRHLMLAHRTEKKLATGA